MVKTATGYENSSRMMIHRDSNNGEFYIMLNNGVTWHRLPNRARIYRPNREINNNGHRSNNNGNIASLKAFYGGASSSRRVSPAPPPLTNVAKKAARKWLMGPARNVILPKGNNTLKAPVNLSFNRGNYAIRYTKRWVRNGTNKSVRLYYSVPTFERLAGSKWPDIYRWSGSEIVMNHSPHLKSDKTRVYRRNLALVRFV